jgi:hypothetical protein
MLFSPQIQRNGEKIQASWPAWFKSEPSEIRFPPKEPINPDFPKNSALVGRCNFSAARPTLAPVLGHSVGLDEFASNP